MTEPELREIKACVFDAYGTLFDVNSAVNAQRAGLGARADDISTSWRDKQLAYTWLRSLMGRHADFWQVTGDALDYVLDEHGFDASDPGYPGLRDALLQAYLQLSPYPEVSATLRTLEQRRFRLAILSNGTPAMLHAAVDNAGLAAIFEAVLSVEAVGIFKPDMRVYQLAVEQLGLPRAQILYLSSNAWDVAGAASFGFRVIWVNRNGQPGERLPGQALARLADLSDVPALLPDRVNI